MTEVYKFEKKRCQYDLNQKVSYVHVKQLRFKLSEEEKHEFKTSHNEYEDITKLHAANNFLTGYFIKSFWFLILTVTC